MNKNGGIMRWGTRPMKHKKEKEQNLKTIKEQKNIKHNLEKISNKEKKNWFHCASLGEYEQIKPIIKQYPE